MVDIVRSGHPSVWVVYDRRGTRRRRYIPETFVMHDPGCPACDYYRKEIEAGNLTYGSGNSH